MGRNRAYESAEMLMVRTAPRRYRRSIPLSFCCAAVSAEQRWCCSGIRSMPQNPPPPGPPPAYHTCVPLM